MTGPALSLVPDVAQPVTIPTTVPGLVIVRDEGARESYAVRHGRSGVPIIGDLAGPETALLATEALAQLLDWTRSAAEIADTADLLCSTQGDVESVAARYGGTVPGRPVYAS